MWPDPAIDAIVEFLDEAFDTGDPSNPLTYVKRPLRQTDSSNIVGVWSPGVRPDIKEIGQRMPTVWLHSLFVESQVKHAIEADGRKASQALATHLRLMLAGSRALRQTLGAVSVPVGGGTERFLELEMIQQLSAEPRTDRSTAMTYKTITELSLRTQTT